MSREIGTSRRRSRVGDVEGPPGYHRCRRRGANPRRSGRLLRPFEVVGHPPGSPLARRGRHGFRAPVPPSPHLADQGLRLCGGAGGEPARRARIPGPRRRPPHHFLAPPTAPPDRGVAADDPPPPSRAGPRGAQPQKAAPLVLCPLRRRPAQPDVAVRLHPLAARHRRRHRDHHLVRRLLPLRPVRHRAPPHHRPHRRRNLQRNRRPARLPRLGAHRQRHGPAPPASPAAAAAATL